ncbi:MAG TPA: hypothetical protein VFR03_12420 [Thermoanaerobaculia bacterium]|nr:hypothetical protein [Thermoanaerobaculia bacterium]
MADACFSRETLERFFRSELSREEARDFVRHLLRQCPRCSRLVREAARKESFQLLLRGLEEAALRSEPAQEPRPLATVAPFPSPEARTALEGEPRRRGRIGRG